MAEITMTFTEFPDVPKRTIDVENTFVTKWETYEDFRASTNYNELSSFIAQANSLRIEVNTSRTEAVDAKDVATTKANEASSSASSALTYKTASESAYNDTKNLTDNLVIPTEARYSNEYVDDIKRRIFLNFKIGEN